MQAPELSSHWKKAVATPTGGRPRFAAALRQLKQFAEENCPKKLSAGLKRKMKGGNCSRHQHIQFLPSVVVPVSWKQWCRTAESGAEP